MKKETYPEISIQETAALMVSNLSKLFEMYNVPEDVGFLICDQDDPTKVFEIKRYVKKNS